MAARVKAVDLLSRREHSRLELLSKLVAKGYSQDEAEDAVDWAIKQGFQSDERFSASLYRRRAPTYGDQLIRAELDQHQVGSTFSVQSEELEPEEDRALKWLERRYSTKLTSALVADHIQRRENLLQLKAKAVRSLGSRGFHFHNINLAWTRFLQDHSEDA